MDSERLFVARIRQLTAYRPAARLLHAADHASPRSVEPGPEDLFHHCAGRHEFAFAVTGQCRIKTPEQDFILSRGQLLLIEPGVDHVELPTDPPGSYVACWCIVDHSYAMIQHSVYSLPESFLDGPAIELHGRTNVQSLAVAIGVELENRAWGWQQSVRALLQYLGCILIRRVRRGQSTQFRPCESPAIAHDPDSWEIVQNALAYCRAHFREGLRVGDVAKAVGYSESRLSHLFSSHLGQSVADHVRGLRLARARDLLATTDDTIAEIAHQVGYADPAHFTRAFLRAHELAPKAYRRRLKGQ